MKTHREQSSGLGEVIHTQDSLESTGFLRVSAVNFAFPPTFETHTQHSRVRRLTSGPGAP